MNRYFILNKFACLSLFILTIATSFKNHPDANKGANTINLILGQQLAGQYRQRPNSIPVTDSLYRLTIKASTFLLLNTDKWIFKFKYIREDTLTLHGWYANGFTGRKFKTAPAIELSSSKTSVLKYSTEMYFGDLVLKRKAVREIKKAIKKNEAKTVLFIPQLDTITHTHVGYSISIETPQKQVIALGETAANPSPPKGFK